MKKHFLGRIFCFLCAAVFCLAGCSGGAADSGDVSESSEPEPEPVYVTNPLTDYDTADPHILRWEDSLYIYSTGGKISRSDDGITWKEVGNVGISPSWGTPGAGFWAPDIVRIGDKLLLYYSLSTWGDSNPGIGVASAEHPEGPWTDHGKLFTSQEIGVNNSIDPCVFVGQDEKVYMIWGSFYGCFGIELTEDGLGVKNGLDYARENKVLVAGAAGSSWDGSMFEGSYVIFRDGSYYYFGSSGTCCEDLRSTYHVRIGRSKNPLGPYVDSRGRELAGAGNVGDTILAGSGNFVGPGHNSVLVDDLGYYYIVYHVWVNDNGEGKGRYLAMSRLDWTEDGWCEVKGNAPSKRVIAPYIDKSK